jgi:hypothetical protein
MDIYKKVVMNIAKKGDIKPDIVNELLLNSGVAIRDIDTFGDAIISLVNNKENMPVIKEKLLQLHLRLQMNCFGNAINQKEEAA